MHEDPFLESSAVADHNGGTGDESNLIPGPALAASGTRRALLERPGMQASDCLLRRPAKGLIAGVANGTATAEIFVPSPANVKLAPLACCLGHLTVWLLYRIAGLLPRVESAHHGVHTAWIDPPVDYLECHTGT